MSDWRLEFKPSAKRTLRKLERQVQEQIAHSLDELLKEFACHGGPYRCDVAKLKGTIGESRFRVGDWRVIFEVQGVRLVVLVLEVGHRRDIYRSRD